MPRKMHENPFKRVGSIVLPPRTIPPQNCRILSIYKKNYREKYHPAVSIRTSLSNYRQEDNGLVNLPLYTIAGGLPIGS